MQPPLIRHIRYEDFIALISQGVGDLEGFRSTVDALMGQMGRLDFHHILVALRDGSCDLMCLGHQELGKIGPPNEVQQGQICNYQPTRYLQILPGQMSVANPVGIR